MPTTGQGEARYPKRASTLLPSMEVDGEDLGAPMLPADILVAVRQLLDLDDDELLAGFAAGVKRVQAGDCAPAVLEALGDTLGVMRAAQGVTRSRLVAWRRRARQMTWPELRVLLLGLKHVVLPERSA